MSLTTILINHIWASIIEIWFQKWHTQSLKKIEIQMSRHEKRHRSEEIAPVDDVKGVLRDAELDVTKHWRTFQQLESSC